MDNDFKRLFDEMDIENKNIIFNKSLNKDLPLSISPSALRKVVRTMEEDSEQMEKDTYNLAKKVLYKWDEFHRIFWELLEENIEKKNNIMDLTSFSNEFILKLQGVEHFEVFKKNFKKIKDGSHILPEIDGNNLGVSWKNPSGRGSSYIRAILFSIYEDFYRSFNNNLNNWLNNKDKVKEIIDLDVNRILYNTKNISDWVNDAIFFLGEKYFREYTQKIYLKNNIIQTKATDWFDLSKKQINDYNLSYLYPNSFLRSKDYYGYFEYDSIDFRLTDFSNTEESKEITKTFSPENFILKLGKASNNKKELEMVANADKEEIKWLIKINNILSGKHYNIDDLVIESFDKIISVLNKRSKDYCINEKELLSENDITKKIHEKLSNDSLYILKIEFGREYNFDFRIDLVFDYDLNKKLKTANQEWEIKRQEYKEKISNAINQENIEVVNEIKGDKLWSNNENNLKDLLVEIDKDKLLSEDKPFILCEAKKISKTQFKNFVSKNESIQIGQMNSYEHKIKTIKDFENREVQTIGLVYINNYFVESLYKEMVEKSDLENELLPNSEKLEKEHYVYKTLEILYHTKHFMDRKTKILYVVIDCESPHKKNK